MKPLPHAEDPCTDDLRTGFPVPGGSHFESIGLCWLAMVVAGRGTSAAVCSRPCAFVRQSHKGQLAGATTKFIILSLVLSSASSSSSSPSFPMKRNRRSWFDGMIADRCRAEEVPECMTHTWQACHSKPATTRGPGPQSCLAPAFAPRLVDLVGTAV